MLDDAGTESYLREALVDLSTVASPQKAKAVTHAWRSGAPPPWKL